MIPGAGPTSGGRGSGSNIVVGFIARYNQMRGHRPRPDHLRERLRFRWSNHELYCVPVSCQYYASVYRSMSRFFNIPVPKNPVPERRINPGGKQDVSAGAIVIRKIRRADYIGSSGIVKTLSTGTRQVLCPDQNQNGPGVRIRLNLLMSQQVRGRNEILPIRSSRETA